MTTSILWKLKAVVLLWSKPLLISLFEGRLICSLDSITTEFECGISVVNVEVTEPRAGSRGLQSVKSVGSVQPSVMGTFQSRFVIQQIGGFWSPSRETRPRSGQASGKHVRRPGRSKNGLKLILALPRAAFSNLLGTRPSPFGNPVHSVETSTSRSGNQAVFALHA